MHRELRSSLVVLACARAAGCASKRPVLYPNAQYRSAGIDVRQADIDSCMQMAETGVGDRNDAANTAGRTAVGAGTGAAAGAAGGAITRRRRHGSGGGRRDRRDAGALQRPLRHARPRSDLHGLRRYVSAREGLSADRLEVAGPGRRLAPPVESEGGQTEREEQACARLRNHRAAGGIGVAPVPGSRRSARGCRAAPSCRSVRDRRRRRARRESMRSCRPPAHRRRAGRADSRRRRRARSRRRGSSGTRAGVRAARPTDPPGDRCRGRAGRGRAARG